MTAPIVWPNTRKPMPPAKLARIAADIAGTKQRAEISGGHRRTVHLGDLWEREAERDVQAHGEPLPPHAEHPAKRGHWAIIDPLGVAAFVAGQIERRRPLMRAAHLERERMISLDLQRPARCPVIPIT